MSERALIVVSRVASSMDGDGFADLSEENKLRAGRVNDDPSKRYPSEGWLAGRARILERVSVPAMRLVSVPFTWVWRACPERRDQAREIADGLFPEAVVTDDRSLTCDEVAPDAERFLTVRLDSDDAIRPGALDEVMVGDVAPGSLVNWWAGWQWCLDTGRMAEKEWPLRTQGPFLGVTHEGRGEMLQSGIPHSYARQGRRVVHVDGRNWVQTLHGRNQLSRWSGREELSPARRRRQLAVFGISP